MREDKLLPWQVATAHELRTIVAIRRQGADLSDMGLGKTYISCAVAESLRPPAVLVLCPAAVRSTWRTVAAHFGIETIVFPDTYNLIRNGKTRWFSKHEGPPPGTRYKQKAHFRYTGPLDSIVIFDEAHNCSGRGTQNGELLVACKRQNVRTLLLSATLAENPLQMRASGYALGLHSLSDYWDWARKQHVVITPTMGPQWYAGKEMRDTLMSKVREQIIPKCAVRLQKALLAHLFPTNIVTADVYDIETAKINKVYEEMRRELGKVAGDRIRDAAHENERRAEFDAELALWTEESGEPEPEWKSAAAAVNNSRFLQEIELLKVPTFLELASDAIAEGNRVVLFVNFKATIAAIRERAEGAAYVEGGQTEEERQASIDAFNRGDSNLAVVNLKAGGTGTSFHDTVGDSPRVALISPTYSARDLQQVLGRCPRAGGKTPVVQKIIYAAGTPEEAACKAVRGKLSCIASLNDGDVQTGLPFDI